MGTSVLVGALLLTTGTTRAETPPPAPAPAALPVVAAPSASAAVPTPSESVAPVGPLTGNPFAQHEPWTPSDSAAVEAAASVDAGAEADLLTRLAEVPTATWLLPETDPLGVVGDRVRDVVEEAHGQGRVPVLVVYGVPGRDCIDGQSAGGLPVDEYGDWLAEIADAAGSGSVVVLEPDALASGNACALPHDRMGVLRDAVGAFAGGPATYVDAGHSGWQDAETVASRLRAVGVERVRGFSLNVSGYGDESAERAFGERVAARTGGHAHFVVDTGRAGAGSNGQWCNPVGRALGAEPEALLDGGAMDARLWVKPPGESDGRCNGGPDAGVFWTQRALEMARAAGW